VKRPCKAILILLGLAVSASALWLYLTHFHYDPGAYSLGVRNGVPGTLLHNVALRLEPHGQFDFAMSLDPGRDHESWFMDPHSPTPTRVFVTFTDPAGIVHTLTTAGAPPKFRGSICVVITKSNDYAAHLELEGRK
jgi:hypothetical protein